MSYKFREELLEKNSDFKSLFDSLMCKGEITEFSDKTCDIISRDKTPIRINGEPFAFKDLFHLDLNEGRCTICVWEFVLLFDKFGIYSEAVECINEAFKGTLGSSYGGHWYVEANINGKIVCFDTSLVIEGSPSSFEDLGYKVVDKKDIDSLFKNNPSLVDYYDNMIINKNFL